MKAAVLEAIGEPLRVQNVDIDAPGEGEALMRVKACGLCHSDYSCAHGTLRAPVPSVLGHEMGGVVEAVGSGVTSLAPGDHVIATLTPACGECVFCSEDKPYLCLNSAPMMINATMLDGSTRLSRDDETVYQLCGIGGFAEQCIVPAGALVKIDKDVPLDLACVLGCGVLTGVGAVFNTAGVEKGSRVVVLGCGGVGLAVIQGARIAGAAQIIAVDPVESRRELAMELGATDQLDPDEEGLAKRVKKLSGGGVHYAFEAIGRVDTIAQALQMCRPSGTAVVVGVPKITDEITIRASEFIQGKTIMGSLYGSSDPHRDIPRLVDWYKSGDLLLDRIVTHRIPLENVNEAFDLMTTGGGARAVVTVD